MMAVAPLLESERDGRQVLVGGTSHLRYAMPSR